MRETKRVSIALTSRANNCHNVGKHRDAALKLCPLRYGTVTECVTRPGQTADEGGFREMFTLCGSMGFNICTFLRREILGGQGTLTEIGIVWIAQFANGYYCVRAAFCAFVKGRRTSLSVIYFQRCGVQRSRIVHGALKNTYLSKYDLRICLSRYSSG